MFSYAFAPVPVALNAFKSVRLLFELLHAKAKSEVTKYDATYEARRRLNTRISILRMVSSFKFGIFICAVISIFHIGIFAIDVALISLRTSTVCIQGLYCYFF